MARFGLTELRLDTDTLFTSDHLAADLAGRTARGGLATMASQFSRFALQTASVIVLARILTPDDFGLISMVGVVVGLAEVFKDAGLALGTVQRDEIKHEQISSVFWINVAILCTVGVVVAAISPAIAWFYHRPELLPVTLVLAAAFVVNGLSVQHDALMRRHMRFKSVAVTQVLPMALSLPVSVGLGLLGWRYWALVGGTVTVSVASTALSFYLCPWVPGRFKRGSGSRALLKLGGDLTSFNVFNYFARNADYILIGRFQDGVALGLYTKAYQLFTLPMTQMRAPLVDVALPALSALKHEKERFEKYYRTTLGALALLTVPLAGYCVVEAEFVVRVTLGPQWSASAEVLRILSVAGVVQSVASTRGLVLLSLGRTRKYLVLGVANSLAMVAGIVAGLRFGIIGVAAGYAAANFLVLLPTLAYSFDDTPVRVAVFLRVVGKPVLFGTAAALAAFGLLQFTQDLGTTGHLLALVAFAGVYVGLSSMSGDARETWHAIVSRLRQPVAGPSLAERQVAS